MLIKGQTKRRKQPAIAQKTFIKNASYSEMQKQQKYIIGYIIKVKGARIVICIVLFSPETRLNQLLTIFLYFIKDAAVVSAIQFLKLWIKPGKTSFLYMLYGQFALNPENLKPSFLFSEHEPAPPLGPAPPLASL